MESLRTQLSQGLGQSLAECSCGLSSRTGGGKGRGFNRQPSLWRNATTSDNLLDDDVTIPNFAIDVTREEASAAFEALLAEAADEFSCPTALTQANFRKAAKNLGLDYFGEAEVHRTWKRLHEGKTVARGSRINHDKWCDMVLGKETLKSLAVQVNASVNIRDFSVRDKFDYQKATAENYAAEGSYLHGVYVQERTGGEAPARRDYTYHPNYTRERQAWQDEVIRLATTRHNPQPRPWIVFTCGAMGCGKGYTFAKLSEWGHFPIEEIVRIDPDYFKTLMPEWKGYLERDLDAGTMTHKESCYIQEVCMEVALRRQQNIWVDGSLRDYGWFAKVFDDIRRRHRAYRIGIIHVHASEGLVRKRIAERAHRTGRDVPEHLIQQSIAAPRHALFELETKCDWVARIDNEVSPTLVCFNQIDRSGTWSAMSSRWARVEPAPYEFPNKMAPIALKVVQGIKLECSKCVPQGGGSVELRNTRAAEGEHKTYVIRLSSLSVMLISQSATGDIARASIGITNDSVWVAYVMPEPDSWEFFKYGGVLYFNQDRSLVMVSGIAGQCSTNKYRHFIEFSEPITKEPGDVMNIISDESRWSNVLLPELLAHGAIGQTWIRPGEIPEAGGLGGFLYELADHRLVLFPVRVPSR